MKLVILLLLMVAVAGPAAAQPSIPASAVVSAASYAYVGLPNSAIAQGSIFTIFVTDLVSCLR